MSYFDDASLVMIPSGYKTDKVYSVKPTDGTGDLTFTRSNDTASRVASNGLIERVRTNLLTYSQDFNNAAWVKAVSTSITASGVTDPNGGTTAVTVSFPNSTSEIYQSLGSLTGSYTDSIYVKGTAGETIALWGVPSYQLFTLTGEWQRISKSNTLSGSTGYLALGRSGTAATATSVSIAFAQFETGDIATDYIATTTAAVSVGPVANVPRLDYLNSSCPRLLLEPQRVNLALFSESFDNATWTKQNGSVTANTTVSPDGYTNADTFTSDSTTGEHNAYSTTPITILSSAFTTSCYVKPLTGRYFCLSNYQAGQNYSAYATFDLQTGTTVATGAIFGTYISNSIQSVGNGWYRVSVTGSGVTSNFVGLNAMTAANFNPSVNTAGQGQSYAIYGVQLEQGDYATSYIPTLGASVTRGAESVSKTGIASLIGQSEGTLFAEFVHNGSDILTTQQVMSVNSGNTDNFVNIGIYDGQLNPTARASSVNIFDLYVGPNPLPAGTHKIALAYKSGDFAIYLNGSSVYTTTATATFGTMGQFDLGTLLSFNLQLAEGIKQAILFPTRLSNADLAALTA